VAGRPGQRRLATLSLGGVCLGRAGASSRRSAWPPSRRPAAPSPPPDPRAIAPTTRRGRRGLFADPTGWVPGLTAPTSCRPCRTRQRRATVRACRWRRGRRRERGDRVRRRGHRKVARSAYVSVNWNSRR